MFDLKKIAVIDRKRAITLLFFKFENNDLDTSSHMRNGMPTFQSSRLNDVAKIDRNHIFMYRSHIYIQTNILLNFGNGNIPQNVLFYLC